MSRLPLLLLALQSSDPTRDFDFWVGTWQVQNRHLGQNGRWRDGGVTWRTD